MFLLAGLRGRRVSIGGDGGSDVGDDVGGGSEGSFDGDSDDSDSGDGNGDSSGESNGDGNSCDGGSSHYIENDGGSGDGGGDDSSDGGGDLSDINSCGMLVVMVMAMVTVVEQTASLIIVRGISGAVNSESDLRSARTLLSRV
ncbi:hypothetical protein PoB_005035000 [Plakobranchus ocellatus]|uniref:Uncharacterized protein n=1 Tax=Plakobranchus ocellatus TaxID=259542 RepID=A0AAV4BTS1_9GAST|nr:hypothetical protein PoB_005035000 [Plakobranchus ocellatus]